MEVGAKINNLRSNAENYFSIREDWLCEVRGAEICDATDSINY
jgi:hypothetical protein